MRWFFRSGITINLALSILIYGVLFFFAKPVIGIFNQDSELVRTAAMALPVVSLSFVPMALNLIYTAFMFSTKRTTQANVIAISRGIVVKAIMIFCIPMAFGSTAIWIAPFIAEVLTLLLAAKLGKMTKLVYQ